jgi:hypothetical protein
VFHLSVNSLETVVVSGVALGAEEAVVGEGLVVVRLGEQVVCTITEREAVVLKLAL